MGAFNLFQGPDIAIDLGTSNILVYVKDRGIVLNEPSMIAIEKSTNRVVAVGAAAREMSGRTPGNIEVIRPLREGVIADYDATEEMIRYFVEKTVGKARFLKPRIMICVPNGVTDVEKRAVLEAAVQAGGGKVYLIDEPVAAALGAGLDISEPCGTMVVDIGGGTTDIAVLSLGGVVKSESIRVGGDRFDELIVRYMKKEYNVLIGNRTAEEIKIRIGTAKVGLRAETLEVRGRDLVKGLPKTVRIKSSETQEALSEAINLIIEATRLVLEGTPPELSSDIMDRGIVMTGGGALLFGLDQVISEATGIPVVIANDTLACVVYGSGKALENLDALKKGVVQTRR
jgi:cell shape determining protein, MreB/Mrl family